MSSFPVFRKYSNNLSFFKITSEKSFIEIQKIGNKKLVHHVDASTYPELNFINDLINCNFKEIKPSDESEFNKNMHL
jgi:hypothetical protein